MLESLGIFCSICDQKFSVIMKSPVVFIIGYLFRNCMVQFQSVTGNKAAMQIMGSQIDISVRCLQVIF